MIRLSIQSLVAAVLLGGIASAVAAAQARPRVIVSTDVGGSDPDDFQSLVHFLLYADVLEVEGLIASPPGKGRAAHILEVIDAYEQDYENLRRASADYPPPDALRKVTRQGAIEAAPAAGHSQPTEGSRWIVERALADDPRPLYVLVWGSITDVAQALADRPAIKKNLRVYSIGSWNTSEDRAARNYIFSEHQDLWWVEADGTFRGMYVGGTQDGDLENRAFVDRHVRGHGALGDLFARKKSDIKMGDTPSVLYLLWGDPDDPTGEHWGGSFVADPARKTHWVDNRDRELKQANYYGAKTVSRWREAFLRDWQARMDRVLSARTN